MTKDEWNDYRADRCYECTGYGDDYYLNDDGELVRACDDCPFNKEFVEDEV